MKSYSDYIVNLTKLRKNCLNIKKDLASDTKFCAIIKADAYGIGADVICKALYGIVDFFGVATLDEALAIRVFDKVTPILILGIIPQEYIDVCAENNISISITSIDQLQEIKSTSKKIKLHIQINTGLNRYGIRSIIEFKKLLRLIDNHTNLQLEGVYSHLATKEKDRLFINIQFYKFLQFKNLVKNRNVICHIANSFATSLNDKYHLDMVRNGYSLYTGNNCNKNSLVLNIKSRVVNINYLKKGDSIGYDRTVIAQSKMTIAVVPIGYADGFDRRLSNKFSVIINDKKCPVVGLVCMDVFMVDVTDMDVKIGDEVIILGSSKNHSITLDDYANVLETSPYEVLLKFNNKRMNYILRK